MDFNETVFQKITDFIQNIGIPVSFRQISEQTFLPGLMIEKGRLLIDKNQLKYIGDTLHEAGHIALMTPEQRKDLSGSLEGHIEADGTEMAVIAWTYAACLEIGIDPVIVFHPDGYKGGGQNIIDNFNEGRYIGVPILEWLGMTERKINTNTPNNYKIPYPRMITWIRKS
jgi:hypothetical protein